MNITGRVLKYGDNIDTDVIIPGRYLISASIQELARHAMEGIDAGFSQKMSKRDILLVGKNFGCGSSREQAVLSLQNAGVKAIVAKSFARIFYRNAINQGLPVIEAPEVVDSSDEDDLLMINMDVSIVINKTKNLRFQIQKIPDFIMEILVEGGLVPWVQKRER